jgi:deoxyribodipyrimidine photo-lyase
VPPTDSDSAATVTWVHDAMLNPARVPEGRPAVFVFDDAWIRAERLSLKRIVFLYECLMEMPVSIRRGDVVEEVSRFAAEHGADRIETLATPIPRLREQGEALGVSWVDPPPFVVLPSEPDLKRFSRYWKKAEKPAFRTTAEQRSE